MSAPHDITNMFAIPLYRASLGRTFTDTEMQFFRRELNDSVLAISNYSSRNKYVLSSPVMVSIREIIEANLAQYFKAVFNTSNKVELVLTQSWLTMSNRGESHHTHTHPNSVASGVLYINLAENDGINFYRNDDLLWHDLLPAQENYFNARRYFINTKAGDLLIFPSNTRHGVNKVEDDTERVSLSFNSFFSGEIGNPDFSTFLKISTG